jgi:geranylgeranyl diphosphate synthase type II
MKCIEHSIEHVLATLHPYKEKVDVHLQQSIDRLGKKSTLRDACEYALTSPGKRMRPILVYLVAEALAQSMDVHDAALATEYFHAASLIADDLPCMDDDDLRRGRPTVHKVYGEATALLASFALIAAGFEAIGRNAERYNTDQICQIAIFHAARLNGIHGLIGGQALDLFPPDLSAQTLSEVIEKKTGALFELSFVLGWLFGGGKKERLSDIQKLSFHFGSAFQILDDLDDYEKDLQGERKVNYAIVFGKEKAIQAIEEHVEQYLALLRALGIDSEPLKMMAQALIPHQHS